MLNRANAGRVYDSSHEPIAGPDWSAGERRGAEIASDQLLRRITSAGQSLTEAVERRPLSFEEQLALVASGKARLVEVHQIRRADPTMTLGGVSGGLLADSRPGGMD